MKQPIKLSRWDWFCLIIPLVSISPLLFRQAIFLWAKQHLQFFPLAFLAAAWFIRSEGISDVAVTKTRSTVAFLAAIVGIIFCFGAVGLYSSWLAHLAFIVLVFSWCLGKFANLSVLRILGICGLMLVTLPPPGNRDQVLVRALQSLSTTVSCLLMDITQIQHVQKGNVIDIHAKSLFVEEACSGVDSQYALMAVAGVMLLVGRAGLFVSLITIVTVPLWAILGNLLRIYSIVVGIEFLGIDLSAGTAHTVLGLVTFSLAAWAHWSSVQFLNWLTCFQFMKGPIASSVMTPPVESVQNDPAAKIPSYSPPRWAMVLPALLLLTTPVLIATTFLSQLPSVTLPKLNSDVEAMLPAKDDLLGSGIESQLVSFVTHERGRDDLMGQHSRAWTFSMHNSIHTCALDLPFRSWHELWFCYQLTGWKNLGHRMVNVESNGESQAWPYFEVRLQHQDGEFAVLHFSHFMSKGEPFVYSQSDERAGLGDRDTRWLIPSIQRQLKLVQAPEPVTFQFQLLSRTSEPATEEQIAKFRSLFLESRERIREKSIPAFQRLMDGNR